MPRTIAVGDIHGCALALFALLETVEPAADDTLVLLGDYVDRGPDSARVIDQLLELESCCQLIPLLGNHEAAMLAAVDDPAELNYWLAIGGNATLDSYSRRRNLADIPAAHIDFVRRCRMFYETEAHFFVHANYYEDLPLDEQDDRVQLWLSLRDHVPGPHESGKTAIVGHTPQRNGDVLDWKHLKCIDTACCYGGWLTALDVDSGDIWQVDNWAHWRRQPQH